MLVLTTLAKSAWASAAHHRGRDSIRSVALMAAVSKKTPLNSKLIYPLV
jgi:hypothetical protein